MVPLVSLIDILTILLIFFILTTRFEEDRRKAEAKAQPVERRLEIALPGVSHLEGKPAGDRRTRISISADGSIFLDDNPIAEVDELAGRLTAMRADDPEMKFELEPDEKAPLGVIIRVWDSLTKAGVPISDVPARVLRSSKE